METATLVKLSRLALDARTPEGEAFSALRKIRQAELDWHTLSTVISTSAGLPAPQGKPKRARRFRDPVMPFGKHRGLRLSEIVQNEPSYLDWVLENCRNLKRSLRRQIELAVELYE